MNTFGLIIFISLLLITIKRFYLAWIQPDQFINEEVQFRKNIINTEIGKHLGITELNSKQYHSIIISNKIIGVIFTLLCLFGIFFSITSY